MRVRFLVRQVLVFIMVGVLMAACTLDGASPTSTATPTAASAPIAPPPSSNPAVGWRPVPDQPALRGVRLIALVRAGQRFVAVGTADGRVLFLDSADGLAWRRGMNLGTEATVAALAAGPRGLVAVGTVADRPASWVSDDGLTWDARADTFPMPALGTDTAAVTDVIADGNGWIAVGREDPDCRTDCGLDPVRALVWTSDDGRAWTRLTGQAELDGGGMVSVARTDTGFVAAGIGSRHAVVWTTSDGTAWSRVPDAQVFHPQPDTDPSAAVGFGKLGAGHAVVVGVGIALGVGPGGAPAAAAWWSTDGRSWATATVANATPDYVQGLAVTTDGFLATGRTVRGNDWFTIAWWSADGRSWVTVPAGSAPDGFDPIAVAASSTVEVAVGAAGTTGPAWWRPVP